MARESDQQPTTIDSGDPPARPGLLLIAGDGRLVTHAIAGDQVTIGRAADCDVVIDHRALSRRHAILRIAPEVTVQDLGSTNGIRVNRGVVQGGEPVALTHGEGFQIGPFTFLVVADRPSERSVRSGQDRLIVEDPTAAGVSAFVDEVARSRVNVLILGETGVGKDVLATTLHARSGRTGPLMRINCAALSESLLESELFGHERGAFTGAVAPRAGLLEAATGGTVFLDEIGELPLPVQAKLLRAVEAHEVTRLGSTRPTAIDVRFVAATNRDLSGWIAAGQFRHDLYFRLDGVTLQIPPLRARRGLIAPLALGFLAAAGVSGSRTSPAVLAALQAHAWPGNVRELKAVIERAVLLARDGEVGVRHLVFQQPAPSPAPAAVPTPPAADDDLAGLTAEQREDRARVVAALDEAVGNQTRAAKRLGISRTTLVNKLSLYRIRRPRS